MEKKSAPGGPGARTQDLKLKLNSDTGQACAAVLLNPNTFAVLVEV